MDYPYDILSESEFVDESRWGEVPEAALEVLKKESIQEGIDDGGYPYDVHCPVWIKYHPNEGYIVVGTFGQGDCIVWMEKRPETWDCEKTQHEKDREAVTFMPEIAHD